MLSLPLVVHLLVGQRVVIAEQALQAPDGVYGSVCACDPKQTPRHLACLLREINVLKEDPKRRRTCGFCNQPWAVIKTVKPDVPLELLEERDETLPDWRWKDIKAGNYWVRIQAGPNVASEPRDVDSDMPDAYTTVQVQLFTDNGTVVNVRKTFRSRSWSRAFNKQGMGKRVKWSIVRTMLDDLSPS
jgi:hypothetical protein